MSRNGSGGYSLPSNSWNVAVNGVSATAADWQALINDVATAIQQSISADGQTPITGNLQMGGNKLTGLAAGSGTGQSLRFEQLFSQGTLTDIASAANLDIGAQLTNFLRVTGTTGITSFGTNYNGPRFLIFAGALILTHSATLVLPGAANITTAANDALIAVPTSGGWQVVAYTRASGIAATAGPLASSGITGAAASGANSDITSLSGLTTPISLIALRSYLSGCTLSTAGASATMSISAGAAMDSTNAYLMQLSAIAKTTSGWAVGTAAGGLDTGTIGNNTWYHFYVIRRPDTGVVDVVFSTSASSPTLPTNYTQFRRIGSGRTNGSAQWTQFLQRGDEFLWFSPVLDVDVTNEPTTAVLRTMTVPTGVKVQALMNARQDPTGTSTDVYFSDPDITDLAPSQTAAPLSSFSARSGGGIPIVSAQVRCQTNTSAQIRTRHSAGSVSNSFRVATYGWVDTRGRDL